MATDVSSGSVAAEATPLEQPTVDKGLSAEPHPHDLARRAVRSTMWVGLGANMNILLGFTANLMLVRLLSPEIFGFFAMANFWTGVLTIRSKFGLNYSAVQYPQTDGQLLGTHFGLNLLISMGTIALGLLAAMGLVQSGYHQQVVLAVIVLIVAESLASLAATHMMLLDKELRMGHVTMVSLAASILAYGVAIGLAWLYGQLWSLLAVTVVTGLGTAVGTYWVSKRMLAALLPPRWEFDRRLAWQLIRRGLPTGLSVSALMVIVSQYDNFLVGTFVDYTTLGFYDRAFKIAHWSNLLLLTVLSRTMFVTFAKVQNDLPRLTHSVRMCLWILVVLGVPIGLTILFGADDVVYVLYGPEWLTSATFLKFLVIYAMLAPFIDLSFWLSAALGHTRATILLTASQALVMVLVVTPLAWQWGVIGVIIGVGLTVTMAFGLGCYYIFTHLPLTIIDTLGIPLVAAVVVIGLMLLLNINHWPVMPVWRIVLIGTAVTGLYWLLLFALQPTQMSQRMKYLWQISRRA